MSKIIRFEKVNQEKIRKQYELEGCADDLVELAEKLVRCDPSKKTSKKKEEVKAQFLKPEDYSDKKPQVQELADEDLDAAAGGILQPEYTIIKPQKD
jgi:hypothetical protein